MIRVLARNENIFESKADILVNPVNCKGVMGKGLAVEFKNRFPKNYLLYKEVCDEGNMKLGMVFATTEHRTTIFNAAVKDHWRDNSEVKTIVSCLRNIERGMACYPDAKLIAIPALGCGLGHLDWHTVRPIIMEYAATWNIDTELYTPHEQFREKIHKVSS